MVKTQSIQIPPGMERLQRRSVQQRDRFFLGVSQSQRSALSRPKKNQLRAQSLFSILAPFWRNLSADEKQSWRLAGVPTGLTNWQSYISQSAGYRRVGDTTPPEPSNFHTGNTGLISNSAGDDSLMITQLHPQKYLVARPIPGQRWKSELSTITEPFSFPITFSFNYFYSPGVSAVGPSPTALLQIRTSYQGQDVIRDYSFSLQTENAWTPATITVSNQLGYFVSYTVSIDCRVSPADLYFDNLEIVHTGTNWARDPRCNFVDRKFTRAFSLVSPFWSVSHQTGSPLFRSNFRTFAS